MNIYQFIISILLGGWFVSLEVRLKNARNELILEKQKNLESSIISTIHNLSDTSLNLALERDLGPINNSTGPDSSLVPKSGSEGKD